MRAPYHILVVEDIASWQKTFKRCLKDKDFEVFIAANYQDAFDLIRVHSFDLVILDVNLTGVTGNYDGLRIANLLRTKENQPKIIIVSGTGDPGRHLKSLNFEPSYLLKKQDFDQYKFIEIVHELLYLERKDA